MEIVIELLVGVVKSIGWGIVFLFVAFVVLPTYVMDRILGKLRPDLISKEHIIGRIKLVFDYIFNQKDVVISSLSNEEQKKVEQEISRLMKEKRLLEGNLFFLDLLQNLSGMLSFSVSKAGYGENAIADILEQSMEYLIHYAKQLKNTEGSTNQIQRVSYAADELREQMEGTISFLQSEEGGQALQVAQITLKQNASNFDSFMKSEYESAKNQLANTNQLLAEKFMAFIES
ncbi:MAG: hypothetical protein K8R73_11835 [Clostridiales bacterium]|nr:hypothetical protein [Clostridiales bacterium]